MKLNEVLNKSDYEKLTSLITDEELKGKIEAIEIEGKTVPYERFKAVNDSLKTVKDELETLKNKGETVTKEELEKAKNEILESKNKEIKALKLDNAIINALKQNKIVDDKYMEMAKGLIKMDKITETEDGYDGLEEQINDIKSNYTIFFDNENQNPLNKQNIKPSNIDNLDKQAAAYLEKSGRSVEGYLKALEKVKNF